MTRGRTNALAIGLAVVTLGCAAAVLHAREAAYPLPSEQERILYLRSGRTADRLMLSFDALASDVYWIRAIQHFGRDRRNVTRPDRFQLLYPLLDLTTTLDPRFNIAYRFGAIFLAFDPPQGPGRPDLAVALLEKGLAANPKWQYAFDLGWVHYWSTHDYAAAADAFERASRMPGAPEWLRAIAVDARAASADRTQARRMVAELARSEEEYIRRAAERMGLQIDALDLIDEVRRRVEAYAAQRGEYPSGWLDLQAARLLEGLPAGAGGAPLDPAGVPLEYVADLHLVRVSPESPLSPMPNDARPGGGAPSP